MKNIINLFENKKTETFIRVIISDEILYIHYIKNGTNAYKFHINIKDSYKLFEYLTKFETTSIELVIKSKTMSCKSILYKNLNFKRIKSLAYHSIQDKKNLINTIFCSNTKPQINFCEALINNNQNNIIKKLFALNNTIRCTTTWPVWIVNSYFNTFTEDKNKFSCSILVLEQKNYLEIICYNKSGFILYRQEQLHFSQHKTEIENIIKYLSQIHKISPEDIAIYILNEEIIHNFATYSIQNMSIISDEINIHTLPVKQNICKIVNFCFTLTFAIVGYNIYNNSTKLTKIKQNVKKNDKIIATSGLETKGMQFLKQIKLRKQDIKKYNLPKEIINNLDCKYYKSIEINIDYARDSISINAMRIQDKC